MIWQSRCCQIHIFRFVCVMKGHRRSLTLSWNNRGCDVMTINDTFFQDKVERIYKILSESIVKFTYYRELVIILPTIKDFTYEYFTKNIPILQKNDLKEDSTRFISDSFKVEELMIDITSGTEGKPLNCYKSSK